jgi:hypothetical protein
MTPGGHRQIRCLCDLEYGVWSTSSMEFLTSVLPRYGAHMKHRSVFEHVVGTPYSVHTVDTPYLCPRICPVFPCLRNQSGIPFHTHSQVTQSPPTHHKLNPNHFCAPPLNPLEHPSMCSTTKAQRLRKGFLSFTAESSPCHLLESVRLGSGARKHPHIHISQFSIHI